MTRAGDPGEPIHVADQPCDSAEEALAAAVKWVAYARQALGRDAPEGRIVRPARTVRVAVVGKYTDFVDSYKSVQEALIHGGVATDVGVEIDWLSSDRFTDAAAAAELLAPYDALLVPGGFGVRGVEGMLEAIRHARETGMPYFGICLGMQTAIIEFARNVCGLQDSHSAEFAPECDNAVISLMESQQHVTDMGGTMRLGAYPCRLVPGSRASISRRAKVLQVRMTPDRFTLIRFSQFSSLTSGNRPKSTCAAQLTSRFTRPKDSSA